MNKKITVKGVVQGVGFRPFIWRLAGENGIKGHVKNTSSGVVIEASGEKNALAKFISGISLKKPPRAEISSVKTENSPPKTYKTFEILKSESLKQNKAAIPADLAVCGDCVSETMSQSDRRHFYPFTNCTNCGPRFSIIERIPYDRSYTVMKSFKLCPDCLREYENPADRRFHAQPNACPVCGPGVWTRVKGRLLRGEKALDHVVRILAEGGLAAIKGLGGFHLACDAFSPKAVERLRKFKDRPRKPFALMSGEPENLGKLLFISRREKKCLNSFRAPVLMLRKKDFKKFAAVSPGLDTAGVMIAYTPLHRVIFKKLAALGFRNPLVMTSGNLRDEPVIKDNEKAEEVFASFDAVLCHDRPIHNRVDDSVCFLDTSGGERLIRRARGYVPESVRLPFESREQALAAGADMKNCFALLRDGEAFLSQHIGDLEEKLNRDFYGETISNMKKLLGIKPSVIVADLHPDYHSRRITDALPGKHVYVQHHVAHVLSVMAETGLKDGVLGVSFDGTGYGPDGKIWGGEFFYIKAGKVERKAHLSYFPLPGGDLCASEIWRSLFSLLYAGGVENKKLLSFFRGAVKVSERNTLMRMIDSGVNSPLTSSVGRLFDAFACLIKRDFYATYEAQGAMELESLVREKPEDFYRFNIVEADGSLQISPLEAVSACLSDSLAGEDEGLMAARFHLGLSVAVAETLSKIRKGTGPAPVCLSGGVFQNRVLTEWVSGELSKRGFKAFFNSKVPANDGGIALGQLYSHLLGIKPAWPGND